MTKAEFLKYAEELLSGESMECLFEQIAEFEGECARFGDGGVGSGLRLQESIAQAKKVDAQYKRLTGQSLLGGMSFAIRGPGYNAPIYDERDDGGRWF